MRKDMNKVLIERPRRGGRGKQRKTFEKVSRPRHKDFLDCGIENDQRPGKESMRKKHKVNGDPKEFSDLLGPLAKFLISRVGQPWNDVWSEICQVLTGNGLQAAHVKGHVKQMVGGVPHSGETSFRNEDWFSGDSRWGQAVYVNEEGILCKSKKSSWHYDRPKKSYRYFRESDTVEYHKLNGCWFHVEIGSCEVEKEYKNYFGGKYTRKETQYFVVNKKALSRKDATKLNLENKIEKVAPKLTLED